jgi:CubicO group peptidase (beta-lactamase class C family)
LAAVLAEAVGTSVLDYARGKLFDPLGITSRPAPDLLAVEENLPAYERAGFAWPHDPQGVHMGFSFLKLTARDMAAFGRLNLDGGRWRGEQVIPTAWVDAATSEQVDAYNSLTKAYGYQVVGDNGRRPRRLRGHRLRWPFDRGRTRSAPRGGVLGGGQQGLNHDAHGAAAAAATGQDRPPSITQNAARRCSGVGSPLGAHSWPKRATSRRHCS